MGLGDFHSYRRAVAMLALVGVAFYSALVPGHIVSQASAAAASGQPLAALDCHRDMAHADGATEPAAPKAPKSDCPFCKGYAVFQTALVAGADAAIRDAFYATPDVACVETTLVSVALRCPQNRGPPPTL